MFRRFASAAAVIVLMAGFVFAAEYRGRLTKADSKSVTVKTESGDKTFNISADTEIVRIGKGDKTTKVDIAKLPAAVEKAKKGLPVTIETKGEGKDEVVTKITIGGRGKGKASN